MDNKISWTILLGTFKVHIFSIDKAELICRKLCSIANVDFIKLDYNEDLKEQHYKDIFGRDKKEYDILYCYYFVVMCNDEEEKLLHKLCESFRLGLKK